MADQKVSTGQKLKESPLRKARVVNLLLDAAARHQRTELSAVSHPPRGQPRSTDVVLIQNITGAARERGDVVQLGAYLCTADTDIHDPWFEGKEPADPLWKCAILGEPAEEDDIVPAHASGVCVAKVDVQSTSHTHARPVSGEHVLKSTTTGPFELLSPATGTGEHLLAVRFDAHVFSLIKITSHAANAQGLFEGKLQLPSSASPGTFGEDEDVWVVFANCNGATLKPVEGIRLFGLQVGVTEADSDERPLYVIDYPLPQTFRATLTQDLLSGGTATATREADGVEISVGDTWDKLIETGRKMASGSKIWCVQECGTIYLLQGPCPVSAS